MFNWTTTTLINEIPENLIKDFGNGKLRIGKHLFEKRWVESIRKAKGEDYKLCKASLDMAKVKEFVGNATVARLYIYVGLEGSEESIYANDWYRKGMPLSVSFAISDPSVMAKAIEDTVKKFNIFTKVKKVLNVTANGGLLTIEGTHEHQRLQKIAIFVDTNEKIGEEKAVLSWDLSECRYLTNDVYKTTTGVDLIEAGKNGFGTYSQLLKDLRLPTAVHNHWLSVQKDEMPIVGATYTQYIINYYAPSTANPSFTAIGNRSMSETTHVFWVKSDKVDEWEGFLKKIDPDGDNDLETERVIADSEIFVNKPSLIEE
jgi:hypothetical protein